MNVSRNKLRRIIKEEFTSLLLEQDLFADDADEGGDTETDEEEAEATEEEEGEEGTPAEDEEAEEAEDTPEPEPDEGDDLSKSIDNELNAVFVDFEEDAIGVAKAENMPEAHVTRRLSHLLFEQEEVPAIDMESFAGDVARLVKNYDSLLDMKRIILRKAEDYITKKL